MSHHHLTCYYCGLHHATVEAGGVYYCPNNLCIGPGAAGFRSKLKSYTTTDREGRHTVDHREWVAAALDALGQETDDAIRRATLESARAILGQL